MRDYFREERSRTVVRHVMTMPVNWADVEKLTRVVLNDMGYADRDDEPADDQIWFEADDEGIAICYELVTGISGGPSNAEPLR